MRNVMADAAQDLRVSKAEAREQFHADMLRASRRYEQAVGRAQGRYAGVCARVRAAAVERRQWRARVRGMSGEHLAQVHVQLTDLLDPARAIRSTEAQRDVYTLHLEAVEEEMTRPYRTQDRSVS
jgi:hypothetical protein